MSNAELIEQTLIPELCLAGAIGKYSWMLLRPVAQHLQTFQHILQTLLRSRSTRSLVIQQDWELFSFETVSRSFRFLLVASCLANELNQFVLMTILQIPTCWRACFFCPLSFCAAFSSFAILKAACHRLIVHANLNVMLSELWSVDENSAIAALLADAAPILQKRYFSGGEQPKKVKPSLWGQVLLVGAGNLQAKGFAIEQTVRGPVVISGGVTFGSNQRLYQSMCSLSMSSLRELPSNEKRH